MSTIANLPAPLLGMLRMQNFGQTPGVLGGTVNPVLELSDFYRNNSTEHGFALFTPAAGFVLQDALTLSGEVLFQVPPGEFWWIEHVSLRLNPAAGISYRGQIVLREDPSQYVAICDMSAVAANPNHVVLRGEGRFWMTPGSRLAANYDTVGGAPGVGSSLMTARFARFRA